MKENAKFFFGCFCCIVLGCDSPNSTPDNYKYSTRIGISQYKRNVTELEDSVESLIKEKRGPFYTDENDSLTKIIVDTILFSPANDKYASFIITENANNKLVGGKGSIGNHFNAYCFIGILNKDSSIEDLTWVGAHILVRYNTLSETSIRIRDVYFKELALRKSLNDESTFQYNLDDIRFWEGPIWRRYYK